tara:strand:+ start:277 stop:1215 length:939 start_codon:yes stop_codon:yes gene_type:complete
MDSSEKFQALVNEIIKESVSSIDLEVTPTIGCPVQCSYCPQNTLIKKYNNPSKDSYFKPALHMKPEIFLRILTNCPRDIILRWTGYVEPLSSPYISDLLKIAIRRGHTQFMNTTLKGATKSHIDIIKAGNFISFNLHLPDADNNMNIKVDDNFIELLDYALNKMDPSKDQIHFIGNPHLKVMNFIKNHRLGSLYLKKDRYLWNLPMENTASRGGNIEDHHNNKLLLKDRSSWKGGVPVRCSQRRFTHPVVLPDGRLTLCCSDYGMEEVHGNLLEEKLDNLIKKGSRRIATKLALGTPNICIKCEALETFEVH